VTPQHIRDRVKARAEDMAREIVNHEQFVASPKFTELSGPEQNMLKLQLEAMRTLHFAWCYRLHHWAHSA
jgi:hypothetical protein